MGKQAILVIRKDILKHYVILDNVARAIENGD